MFWDTHMHCRFSGDSEAEPEVMLQAAMNKNLSGICFTDHLDYDFPEEPNIFLLDIPNYKKKILSLQQEYEDVFPINLGIEIGLQDHLVKENNKVIEENDFDFVIGSSHVINHQDPYFPEFFEGRPEEESYMEYFETVLKNVNTDVDFDVYGHIDYVVRYGPNKNKYYSYAKYAEIIDEILKSLIKKDKGIEVNTGGFKYGLGQPNPCFDILKRYRQLGGEILTIGADAHAPEHVAYDFDKLPPILKEAGFEYFTVFTARVPSFYPIP